MFVAKSSHWDVREKQFAVTFQNPVGHVGGEPSGSDSIHLNVVRSPLASKIFGEGNDSALAGVISDCWQLRGGSAQSSDRSDINDLSPAPPNHNLAHRLTAQEGSSQVRLDDLRPILELHGLDRSAPRYAGVVH